MNVAHLVLDYLKTVLASLASWPVAIAVVVLLFIFRFDEEIRKLIPRLKSINSQALALDFYEQASPPDSASPARRPSPPGGAPSQPGSGNDSSLFSLNFDTAANDLPTALGGTSHENRLSRGVLRLRDGAALVPGGKTDSFGTKLTFRILSDYGKPTSWVGILLGANNPLLGSGYLVYWRSNGSVEIFSPELEVIARADAPIVPTNSATLTIVGERDSITVWAYKPGEEGSSPLLQIQLEKLPLWRGDCWLHAYEVLAEITELRRWVRRIT